jgi:hypothetical protein
VIFLEKRHREARLSQLCDHTPIFWVMQHLDLTDEEAAALIKEFADITGNDRYPFSPQPDLEGDPGEAATRTGPRAAPPPKVYAPPRATAARRRR